MEAPKSGEFAGRFYYLAEMDAGNQGRKSALASIVLPDDAVKNLLVAVGDPRMVIKPGLSVSLDIGVDGSIQQQVTDSFLHNVRSFVRERHGQYRASGNTFLNQMRHPIGDHSRLSGSRTRED